MGKVRPTFIKKAARQMVELYPDYLSADFEKNKEFLKHATVTQSKHVRNRIAGYITHIYKK